MKSKTIEEIRTAVLAECERLCPNVGDSFDITPNAKLKHVLHTDDWHQWEIHCPIFNGDGYTLAAAFKMSPYPSCSEFTDFYRLLGLEARDAADAEAAKFEGLLHDQLKAARSHYTELLEAERARSTKLVEALESISKAGATFTMNPNDHKRISGQLRELCQSKTLTARAALKAHKKGGSEG